LNVATVSVRAPIFYIDPLPAKLSGVSATVFDDVPIVCGGHFGMNIVKTCYIYAKKTWIRVSFLFGSNVAGHHSQHFVFFSMGPISWSVLPIKSKNWILGFF
jgi:hypothetical protein